MQSRWAVALPWLFLGWMSAVQTKSVLDDPNSDIKQIPLRTHSLISPYLDTDMQSRWWEFGGDTIIRADQYIRLASDRPSQAGWIFSRLPLTATNWQLEVEFQIKGKGNLHGDGMAIWITKERASAGPVFGSVDNFEGLGIFFDTYKNNRPGTQFPYVMAMLGNGKTSYNKDTDGKENELAGCSARGLRGASIPTKARLTYFQDESLKLELQYKIEDQWILCFEHGAVTIPSIAHLGFSAETGELSDDFDVISVEVKNLYSMRTGDGGSKGDGTYKQKGRSYDPNKSQGSGWGWTFVKIVLFLLICGAAYVGYTTYRTSTRGSRFD